MGEIENNIIQLLEQNPGLSDRELAGAISGHGASSHYINQTCRVLVSKGVLQRKTREDGLIGNWLAEDDHLHKPVHLNKTIIDTDDISEKKMKQILEVYLTSKGWEPQINWGFTHGIDIEAKRGMDRWIIEVKGSRSLNPLCVNYFLLVLGEIFQRMDVPNCKYSIALPDIEQFRRLWERLPLLAKNRIGITALFVNLSGNVTELIQ